MATKKVTVKDETTTPESGVRVVSKSKAPKAPGKTVELTTAEEIDEFQAPDRVDIPTVQSEAQHASQAPEDIRDGQAATPNA